MTYYEYDGGIAVVLGSDKAFAWDDIDNAWKPVVASEIYGDERAIEVAEDSLAETLDAHEATPYVEASSKNIFVKLFDLVVRMRTLLVVATSLVFTSSTIWADEILSKSDARLLFNQSFKEWRRNVEQLQTAGVARYDSIAPLEYSLIANTPFGRLITTPTFPSAESKPSKLSVSVVYKYPQSSVFLINSVDQHKDFIEHTYKEMLPEYTVMTEIKVFQTQKRVVHSFQIFHRGDYPILDLTAAAENGCWQNCVKITQ